jgi:hypothetical protein
MNNPLANHFRQKEIYVRLPTQGKWLSNKPKLTEDGEIGIMPMTLQDEILLSIPDSLYNGESLFKLISSIVPDIADPYELSLPDFDVILLASRAATYDKKMSVESFCTHCDEPNMYEIDLPSILSKVRLIGQDNIFEIDGLVFELRPNTVAALNTFHIKNIQSTSMLRQLHNSSDQDKLIHSEEYQNNLSIVSAANIALIADAIVCVTTPDGTQVKDMQHIIEYVNNAKRHVITKIEEKAKALNNNGLNKTFNFTCSHEECLKDFEGAIEFNPAFFFRNIS